uniref:DUF3421 domain-containing protein n=1 Tax=Syphacia muris TaxID=451379 RepID=A0A0N5AZL6_9BILA
MLLASMNNQHRRFVMKEMFYPVLLILFFPVVFCCTYEGNKYRDGQQWTVRSTFVMECTMYKNGSWIVRVVACKTMYGKTLNPGDLVYEAGIKYECIRSPSGGLQIQRTYKSMPVAGCEGHSLGESWLSNKNFNKTCFATGTKIMNCLTDTGVPIPLNSRNSFDGVLYVCTKYPNGTVILGRETAGFTRITNASPNSICNDGGKVREPGEKWVDKFRFMKHCTPDGQIVIDGCLLEDNTTLYTNSKLFRNGKLYFCSPYANVDALPDLTGTDR